MLWCDSVAPLGKPVVPEVYWMLIGSSNDSVAARSRRAAGSARRPVSTSSSQPGSPMNTTGSNPISASIAR